MKILLVDDDEIFGAGHRLNLSLFLFFYSEKLGADCLSKDKLRLFSIHKNYFGQTFKSMGISSNHQEAPSCLH